MIVESIKSHSPLPRGRREVGRTSLNLCVDCFSLLVAVPVVLVVSPAASSLRQVGGFLKCGCCVPPTAAHNTDLDTIQALYDSGFQAMCERNWAVN